MEWEGKADLERKLLCEPQWEMCPTERAQAGNKVSSKHWGLGTHHHLESPMVVDFRDPSYSPVLLHVWILVETWGVGSLSSSFHPVPDHSAHLPLLEVIIPPGG